MSRDDGFAIADTDTGLMADPKVLALARRLRDSTRTGAALALYDAVRLASWKAGERLTLDETVPGWWLDPYDDLADALVEVNLLDDERRIPERAWEGWYGPAFDRRERFRELGARGGRANALAHGRANGRPHGVPRPSDRPTDRPIRARASADGRETPARSSGQPEPIGDVLGGLALVNGEWVVKPTGEDET